MPKNPNHGTLGKGGNQPPMISLIPAFVAFAVVPFGPPEMFEGLLRGILSWFPSVDVDRVVQNSIASGGFVTDINIAVLFVLSVSSVGILGIILGGWASNRVRSAPSS